MRNRTSIAARGWHSAIFIAALVTAWAAAGARAAEWVDVTGNVGGAKWGAYGVHYLSAVPGSSAVIAGVSEAGLWKSADGGATWTKLGGDEIRSRPDRIVYDPRNPDIFWVSGCYGDAPFRTDDGGKTFQRLGRLSHADGIAVDFTDPERRTLLLGLHEQSQSLELSTDRGATWTKIGSRLPPESNHSSDPIVIDAKTFLINTAGWKPKASLGIYRSADGGATWQQVSNFGPAGQALAASDGALYWQRIWGGGLLKSTDQGKTWNQISRAIKNNPIELDGGRLAGVAGEQIMVSADGGQNWSPLGPKLPFQPSGIVYSAEGQAFYAWHMADNLKRPAESIVRWGVK